MSLKQRLMMKYENKLNVSVYVWIINNMRKIYRDASRQIQYITLTDEDKEVYVGGLFTYGELIE